ncbi:MAG: phosphoribosyl-ATP diphosphatase [Halobacteria archaeon]|nr:phosphoribosyl-ATP diphosphatase [Halobacteria archaeon]
MTDETEIISELYEVIEDRRDNPRKDSYTSELMKNENEILEKLGEETTETIIAAKDDEKDEVIHESADIIYHLFVLLASKEVELEEILDELGERRN